MNVEDDLIYPLDQCPVEWEWTASRALAGQVHVAFTAGGLPDGDSTWHLAVWATGDATALKRVAQIQVKGSEATGDGVHPGTGNFTAYLRYTEGALVRVRRADTLRFR